MVFQVFFNANAKKQQYVLFAMSLKIIDILKTSRISFVVEGHSAPLTLATLLDVQMFRC